MYVFYVCILCICVPCMYSMRKKQVCTRHQEASIEEVQGAFGSIFMGCYEIHAEYLEKLIRDSGSHQSMQYLEAS